MNVPYSAAALEKAVVRVSAEIEAIRSGNAQTAYDERQLLSELIACILGSQVSFEMAISATHQLLLSPVFDKLTYVHDPIHLEGLLSGELSRPIADSNSPCHGRRYRFWRTKARAIAQTMRAVYGESTSIRAILSTSVHEHEARDRLVRIAVGIGPKQASLFLRNIGYAANLAVLDSHVLRYMRWLGMVRSIPRALQSVSAYEVLERKLAGYASVIGYPLKFIDEAIWVVMRVAGAGVK
jgi:N-glycosylase/DNA lyase